jgi:large subunit ribosomal protein L30
MAMAETAGKAGGRPTLKVTLVRSTIGFNRKQAEVVTGLGLRRIRHTVEVPDTPETRGMIRKVRHLVSVDEG